jgi:DNA polymerase III subunit gamma/tau
VLAVCLAFRLLGLIFGKAVAEGLYQVLYRKWRPKRFSDVVGQPQVTVTLKNELRSGRIAHAYLFTGSRGTGKTTCAKILAKAVNCLNPQDGDPCGECEICKGVENGSIMDIVEIDAASNNGVENIRTLREEAHFTPAAAKYRVYIIDEVHMLSVGAFNALLKTLEEPPAHVIFILATTEVHKIPATILSRCQRFDFHRIPPQEIADRLTYVAEQENARLDPQAAMLIARLADGAMRDALSILDQCFGRSKDVTEQVVAETAGLVGREHLLALADAIKAGDSAAALEIVDRLYRSSKDMARLCEEMSSHFRGMMLIKTMKNAREILAVPETKFVQMEKQALSTPLPVILHAIDTMQETLEKMYRGGDRRTVFEMAMIRLCTPQLDTSAEALLRRIEALEQGAPQHAPAQTKAEKPQTRAEQMPPAQSKLEPQERAENAAKPAEGKKDAEQLQKEAKQLAEWPEILQIIKSFSPAAGAAFTGSTAYISGNYVLIDAPNQLALKFLRQPNQRENIRQAIKQVLGKSYSLGPYRKPEKNEAEEDPLAVLAKKAEAEGIEVIKK